MFNDLIKSRSIQLSGSKYIISKTGRNVEVSPYKILEIPIVGISSICSDQVLSVDHKVISYNEQY